MNLDVGSIAGDYQIIGTLGAGGMGKVYKVRNAISDRVEAMKVLLPDLAGAPELADRFLREIKVQASLDHPNIASLRTAVRFENQLLMIMELVDGITLEQKAKQGPLSVAEAVEYVGQVLAALAYAHRAGVIHRDIKPANMMLTANGVIKLMDFGIAKAATDRKLTMTGTTMGSLYYMSPEQIRGEQTLDARADLYSVGVSLYELVTGRRPFDGDSQFSIMSAHLEKAPVPPVSIDPKLPAALNDLILLSVEKDPNRRFQTADAFRNALVSVTAPMDAAPVAPAVQPPASRRMLWVAAGAVCAVAAVVGVIEFAPKKEAAAGTSPTPVQTVAPPAPSVQTPPPVSVPAAAVPEQTPPATAPSRSRLSSDSVPRQSNDTRARPNDTEPRPSGSGRAAAAAPAASEPAQASPAPPKQAEPTLDIAARRAELQKIRESLAMLSARVAGIRSTMQNLQRSQAASGLGMRSDWVQAASLMETFLKGANDALGASDAAAAQDFMNKAERHVDRLETALNK